MGGSDVAERGGGSAPGFTRLTDRIQSALQHGLDLGLRRGDLHLQDDRAVLSR